MKVIKNLFHQAIVEGTKFFFTADSLEEQFGKKKAEEIQKERISICEGCPKFNRKERRCLVCACYMDSKTTMFTLRNIKAGGRIEQAHCPEARWFDEEIQIANYYRKLDNKPLLKK